MKVERSAFEVAMALAKLLEEAGIPYALGGALAYAAAGIPRATVDVDVNVFVGPDKWASVFEVLQRLGAKFDFIRAREEAESRGMFEVWLDHVRIDVFTPSIDFSWEAERTRLPITIDGERAYYLSPEALSVFKLLFFRSKDLADLERLISVAGSKLNVQYVREQIALIMGDNDVRTQTWDRLVKEFSR